MQRKIYRLLLKCRELENLADGAAVDADQIRRAWGLVRRQKFQVLESKDSGLFNIVAEFTLCHGRY